MEERKVSPGVEHIADDWPHESRKAKRAEQERVDRRTRRAIRAHRLSREERKTACGKRGGGEGLARRPGRRRLG